MIRRTIIKLGRSLWLFCILTTVLGGWQVSVMGDDLNRYVAHALEHRVRSWLGQDPALSPRIKIFAYDDASIAAFQRPEISIGDWSLLLKSLQERKPQAIFIDKVFGFPEFGYDVRSELDALSKQVDNVVVGAFPSDHQIKGREPLEPDYLSPWPHAKPLQPRFSYLYGPALALQPVFKNVGHLLYEGKGEFFPILAIGEHAVPHLALKAAPYSLEIDDPMSDHQLVINGGKVPLQRNGSLRINVANPDRYESRTRSMQPLIESARQDLPISVVNPDDIVVLIPGFFTGATDFVSTPLGNMPGGYVITAIINSVLTGHWIASLGSSIAITFVAQFLGLLLGLRLTRVRFWPVLIMLPVCAGVVALGFFSFHSVSVPWFYPILGFLSSGLLFHAHKTNEDRAEKIRLEVEMKTAQIVQKSFFPNAANRFGDFAIAGQTIPATECSGDWWGYYPLPDGKVLVVVGDATGHGAPPALLTAAIWSCFGTILKMSAEESPAKIVQIANDIIEGALGKHVLMSLIVCLLDPETQTIRYTNAGHLSGVLITDPGIADKKVFLRLRATNNLLGHSKDETFVEKVVTWQAGDRLILFTDGITERANHKGQQFRERLLLQQLRNSRNVPAAAIMTKVFHEAQNFAAGDAALDDATVVVVSYK